MQVPITMPLFDRPEFLAEVLRTLGACRGIDKCVLFGYQDCHEDKGVRRQIADLFNSFSACRKELTAYPHRLENKAIPTALISTRDRTDAKWQIVLESDVIVADSFVQFLISLADYYLDDPAVYQVSGDRRRCDWKHADITRLIRRKWVSSLGHVLFSHKSQWFFDNVMKFCDGQEQFAMSTWDRVPISNPMKMLMIRQGRFFNLAWGGCLTLDMALANGTIVVPYSHSQCAHIGYYGWHISKDAAVCGPAFEHVHTPTIFEEHYPEFTINFDTVAEEDLAKAKITWSHAETNTQLAERRRALAWGKL